MKLTTEHVKAVGLIGDAVTDVVKATGKRGAPAGVLYAALSEATGMTLDQFQQIMSALVAAGKLRRNGDLYFINEKEKPNGE